MNNDDSIGNIAADMEHDTTAISVPAESNIGIDKCEHYLGGSELNHSLRLRRINQKSPEAFQELASELQAVAGRWVDQIQRQKFGFTRKYLSQVLPVRDSQHHHRILERLRTKCVGYSGAFFLWVDEGDHFHIVHDCPYSNGQCRCSIFKDEDLRFSVRSPLRTIRRAGELDRIDWYNVFLYFLVSKWPCNSQVWIGGRLQESTHHDQVVRWRRLQEESRKILARQDEGIRHNDSREQSAVQDGGDAVPTSSGITREKRSITQGGTSRKKSKFERISETVQTLLRDTYCIPADHIRDIYAHDPVSDCLYDPSAAKFVDAACTLFTQRVNHLTLRDFKELYDQCTPVFYCNGKDPFTYYHNRQYSANIIDKLLYHQCGGDEEAISMFLTNIVSWFNKDGLDGNPKCNALCVIGPPNSGKNYFFDMLSGIAFNVGHIGRVNNKTNNFALQECYGRRMIVGNEISMEDGALEDFKKLCEGTAFNIRVKFQGDKIFTKCPVLLISNYSLQITNHPHFEGIRSKTIRWNNASLLKESTLKPYPMCIFDILNKYNISY